MIKDPVSIQSLIVTDSDSLSKNKAAKEVRYIDSS